MSELTKTLKSAATLYTAQLTGQKRKESLKGLKIQGPDWNKRGFIHSVRGCKSYRTGKDTLMITDGAGGYTLFSISGLENFLAAMRNEEILTEVKI